MLDIPEMLYEFSSMAFFLVPMVALVVLYMRMGLRIRQTEGQRMVQEVGREKTKKVVLKMLGNNTTDNVTLVYDDHIQLLWCFPSLYAGHLSTHRDCCMWLTLNTGSGLVDM